MAEERSAGGCGHRPAGSSSSSRSLIVARRRCSSSIDSHRVGAAWGDDGPQVGLLPEHHRLDPDRCRRVDRRRDGLCAGAARRQGLRHATPTSSRCCRCSLPTIVYVVADQAHRHLRRVGALHRRLHDLVQGKYKWPPTLGVSVGVPVAIFLLFEIWFLVPLPKGPLERMLGY